MDGYEAGNLGIAIQRAWSGYSGMIEFFSFATI
jgi:hypothetical protein